MSITRGELVSVIASHQWDRYTFDPEGGSPAELSDELAKINDATGFTVDVPIDGAGRRRIRYENVRLTDAELDTVVAIATDEAMRIDREDRRP